MHRERARQNVLVDETRLREALHNGCLTTLEASFWLAIPCASLLTLVTAAGCLSKTRTATTTESFLLYCHGQSGHTGSTSQSYRRLRARRRRQVEQENATGGRLEAGRHARHVSLTRLREEEESGRSVGQSRALRDGAEVEVDGEERIAYFGGSGALVALTLVGH